MGKKKKNSAIKDVVDLTKLQVASSVSIMVTGSLPETPQVPAMGLATRFTGSMMGVGQIVKAAKIPLKGLTELEKLSRQTKRRRR